MHDFDAATVRLEALSNAQRDLVESHLPLVQHTLNRHRHLLRGGRDAGELFQEGCLALIEAVRHHDPQRYGHFAAYAMARIHFALSKFVHENDAAVRVPFITQRRRRAAENMPREESAIPLPVVQRLADAPVPARQGARPGSMGLRIGEMIRERIEAVMTRVISDMKGARRCAPGTREVIELCARERWGIPEPESRLSIRKLAHALDCSVGRITHCEERFRRGMHDALTRDPAYRTLRKWARRSKRGFDEPLPPERLAKLRPE